jgi:hypothetical protein
MVMLRQYYQYRYFFEMFVDYAEHEMIIHVFCVAVRSLLRTIYKHAYHLTVIMSMDFRSSLMSVDFCNCL